MPKGDVLFFWIGYGLIFGLLGVLIGRVKNRRLAGFVFGLLLGPLGWLIVLVGPNLYPKCPECGGVVVPNARKCKNCGSVLSSPAQ